MDEPLMPAKIYDVLKASQHNHISLHPQEKAATLWAENVNQWQPEYPYPDGCSGIVMSISRAQINFWLKAGFIAKSPRSGGIHSDYYVLAEYLDSHLAIWDKNFQDAMEKTRPQREEANRILREIWARK